MAELNLKAKIRTKGEQKAEGVIPAVIYGNKVDNINLWINLNEFNKIEAQAGGSVIVNLEIADEKGKKDVRKVLIYDYQRDPVSNLFRHIDFYQVNMKEEIEATVELMFEGVAPAVKELGGTLVRTVDEVAVTCLPEYLPKEIKVDLSVLKTFDDKINAKDLVLPEKVELELEQDLVIASVAKPRSEEELSDLDQEVSGDISEVEGMEEKETEAKEQEEQKEETQA